MAMGGFGGSDPAPTLARLKSYVREGRLRFVLLGGFGGGPGGFGGFPGGGGFGGFGGGRGGDVARERSQWVSQACTPVTIGSQRTSLYDCEGAAG
jgi:hypothetical protein